ncbi:MAG: hypothetical protein GXY92_00610 [Syntrophomonadaceae bacterium]|nr:hypothetical protein [Syntrophomonadaceae bacterium]
MDITFDEFLYQGVERAKPCIESELEKRKLLDRYLDWCQSNYAEPYDWKTLREWDSKVFDEIVANYVRAYGPFKPEEYPEEEW